MPTIANICRLGVKELWSLARDPVMLLLIVHAFTISIYVSASAMPETLNKAPIVDEDDSPLSNRIASAFFLTLFKPPKIISLADIDRGMDSGDYTFVLNIPPNFQRDVLDGKSPSIQMNVDATRMGKAFSGSSYIQQMVLDEVNEFVLRYRTTLAEPVELPMRARFNPNLDQIWFGGLMEIINNVTMLSIILTGSALIREREHGTIKHLLVMPVTPAEIRLAKIWSMGLVVLLSAAFSLVFTIQGILKVPIEGSIGLFLIGSALHLFAASSMGILMATLARSMPQFGMLAELILLPLQMLSGNSPPRESMPEFVQNAMLLAPTTHFVMFSQAILFRGASVSVVWPQFLALAMIDAPQRLGVATITRL